MKKLFERINASRLLSNLLVLLAAVAFYMILLKFEAVRNFFSGALGVFAPLIWGAVIAYILNPLSKWVENSVFKRMKRRRAAHSLSVTIAFVFAFAVLALIVVMIVPQVISSGGMLFNNLEGYFESFKEQLIIWTDRAPWLDFDVEAVIGTWSETFKMVSDWMVNNIDSILGASYRVGTGLVEFLLAVVFSVYILLDKDNILRSFRRFSASVFKESACLRINEVCAHSNKVFLSFLGGNILDSVIIGVANFIFMLILSMPYPLLISVIVAVTNFIPTFGPVIGAVPSALIILMINPWQALWFLIFTVAIQLLDANLIKPLLFGDSTGLRPLWVLVAIILGGRMFGLVGMILGIPVLAIISEFLDRGISSRLKARGYDDDGEKSPDEDGSGE